MWMNFSRFLRGEDATLIEKKTSVMKEERLSYCIAPDFIEDEVDLTVLSNADEDYQQMVTTPKS